jgi:MFS family permease
VHKSSLIRFAVSRFCSAMADQLLLFALPLIVFQITHNITYSGLALFCEWLPRILSLPIAGALADRVGGWKIYGIADATRLLACGAAFFAFPILAEHTFTGLMVLSAICAVCYAQAFVSLEATVPLLVPLDEMPKAQSLLQGIDQTAMIAGPFVGAIWLLHGEAWTLLGCAALLFGVSAVAIWTLRTHLEQAYRSVTRTHARHPITDLVTAAGILRNEPLLLGLTALSMGVNLIVGLALATGAPLMVGRFGQASSAYGVLQGAVGVLSIALFPLVPLLVKKSSTFVVGISAYIGILAGAVCLGTQHLVPFALGFMLALSLCGPFNVYIRSERVRRIAPEHFGKTIGLIVLMNQASIPFAGLIVSLTAHRIDIGYVFFAAATLGVLLAIIVLPRLHVRNELAV